MQRNLVGACRSNAFDDDLPYRDAPAPALLVPPYALDTNDMKFFQPNGFARAEEFARCIDDAIAQLLAEASRGAPGLLGIGLHPRISGRPARFRAAKEILTRLAALRPRMWVARRIEIAEWLRPRLPRPALASRLHSTSA